jgi:hypothetical protein
MNIWMTSASSGEDDRGHARLAKPFHETFGFLSTRKNEFLRESDRQPTEGLKLKGSFTPKPPLGYPFKVPKNLVYRGVWSSRYSRRSSPLCLDGAGGRASALAIRTYRLVPAFI